MMNGFERDEFFTYQSNVEDLKPGIPPPTSHQSSLVEHSISDGIATSSVTDITEEFFDCQLFLDHNVASSVDIGKNLILDGNSFINCPNESTSPATISFTPNADPTSSLTVTGDMDFLEVPEFTGEMVFSYISQMLMEENMDGKFDVYPEHPALLAAENSFSEIVNEKFPPLPDQNSSPGTESSDVSIYDHHVNSNGSSTSGVLANNRWPYDPVEFHQLQTNPVSVDYSSHSSFSLTNSAGNVNGLLENSLFTPLVINDLVDQSAPAWQFHKGLEEARRFLPSDEKLVIDLEAKWFHLPQDPIEDKKLVEINAESEKREDLIHEPRGRKKTQHDDDLDLLEGRSNKQPAFSPEETLHTKLFDDVLLFCWKKHGPGNDKQRAESDNETGKSSHGSRAKVSGAGKGRGKKQPKKEVVDLRTLLVHCAQSVAINDRRSAIELLKQIRQHSSPFGDANERLAHCFADGLEARLAVTGSQIYHSIVAKRISTVDMLKAYQCYMRACPVKRIAYFFSNSTILNVAKNATRLHIIDFGIYHGFQWPCFMKRLADRTGGPPRLRITGIDVPRPGFRPTERVDETGQRLADYARRFGIPFEFQAIATKWEMIKIEDLNIDQDEVLVVNSLFQFKNLMDETVLVEDSPRNMVLNIIRNMNPAVFIFGIVNGSYNSPFFVTRFREALFFFSALFDMIETNVPREDESRLLIEKNIFGRDALNVIACESSERVERPETYKQWQVRNLRAGFKQLPLSPDIMKMAKEKLEGYHKDFVVDVNGQWLLEGWKGRITYALSTWKSNDY